MSSLRPALSSVLVIALTLAISAGGGLIAHLLGLPAGWLMGGALAVTIATMAGLPVAMPDRVRDVAFVAIGMSMGASVASESLSLLASWPISLAALAIELVIIVAMTGWMLVRLFNLDIGTAYLSSFPGHLSLVMGIAATGVGDSRQIVIIQVIRIFMLTVAVPIGAMFLPIEHFAQVEASKFLGPIEIVVLTAACVAGGLLFVWRQIPAGLVLGAMAVATVGKLAGIYDGAMPKPLVICTFVLTGALIGTRFGGITKTEFLSAAKGGLIATAMTLGIVTLITFVVSQLVNMPFGQIWLGLAPGALEGMGALGIALGYDTAFIAAHHVIRLLLLSLAIPFVVMLVRWQERRAKENRI